MGGWLGEGVGFIQGVAVSGSGEGGENGGKGVGLCADSFHGCLQQCQLLILL